MATVMSSYLPQQQAPSSISEFYRGPYSPLRPDGDDAQEWVAMARLQQAANPSTGVLHDEYFLGGPSGHPSPYAMERLKDVGLGRVSPGSAGRPYFTGSQRGDRDSPPPSLPPPPLAGTAGPEVALSGDCQGGDSPWRYAAELVRRHRPLTDNRNSSPIDDVVSRLHSSEDRVRQMLEAHRKTSGLSPQPMQPTHSGSELMSPVTANTQDLLHRLTILENKQRLLEQSQAAARSAGVAGGGIGASMTPQTIPQVYALHSPPHSLQRPTALHRFPVTQAWGPHHRQPVTLAVVEAPAGGVMGRAYHPALSIQMPDGGETLLEVTEIAEIEIITAPGCTRPARRRGGILAALRMLLFGPPSIGERNSADIFAGVIPEGFLLRTKHGRRLRFEPAAGGSPRIFTECVETLRHVLGEGIFSLDDGSAQEKMAAARLAALEDFFFGTDEEANVLGERMGASPYLASYMHTVRPVAGGTVHRRLPAHPAGFQGGGYAHHRRVFHYTPQLAMTHGSPAVSNMTPAAMSNPAPAMSNMTPALSNTAMSHTMPAASSTTPEMYNNVPVWPASGGASDSWPMLGVPRGWQHPPSLYPQYAAPPAGYAGNAGTWMSYDPQGWRPVDQSHAPQRNVKDRRHRSTRRMRRRGRQSSEDSRSSSTESNPRRVRRQQSVDRRDVAAGSRHLPHVMAETEWTKQTDAESGEDTDPISWQQGNPPSEGKCEESAPSDQCSSSGCPP